ncbi:MAG TPA: hypothetical protein VF236_03425 [Gaiellaceae bacterium]
MNGNSIDDTRPFGAKLRDLLIENGITTRMGNPDWAGFCQLLRDVHYETLRKAVVGERHPAPKLIEAVTDALDLPPETFAEYRLWEARRQLDPQEVGFEQAVRSLDGGSCGVS